jgi:glycosyltransferase involved in cell wall biosynthesis
MGHLSVNLQLGRLLGRRRSDGMYVSRSVYKWIRLGNTARASQRWGDAVTAYQAALGQAPHLGHIWMQLGHAAKEAGDLATAGEAYSKAELRMADNVEAVVYRGDIARRQLDGAVAIDHYLRAFRLDPKHPLAFERLHMLLGRNSGVPRELVAAALRAGGLDIPAAVPVCQLDSATDDAAPRADNTTAGAAIVFDASDLLSYFRNARLPTGIQRVQIATICGALADPSFGQVHICCFSDEGDSWTELPADAFVALSRMAVDAGEVGDPAWRSAMAQIQLTLAAAPAFVFPKGATLVNLGTSWWLQNYFLFVREAKRQHGIRYVPFVHDLIPVMTPEHCVQHLTEDFISWVLGAFQHADFFLVNSEATRRDLLTVAATLGHTVDPTTIATIQLNGHFGADQADIADDARLSDWGLSVGNFVLFVSTIESRKNHVGALDAWAELLQRHGRKKVPRLVCVGNRGWLNDAVYARIASSAELRKHVVMLSGLSDAELRLLYERCRFTLYPSNYEGWGLPVTEALCHGKVPLVSDSSSLPEAGGPFAVYFKAGSTPSLIDAAERLILDDDGLAKREAKIKAEFRSRSWESIAQQISSEVVGFAARSHGNDVTTPPAIRLNTWYPLRRNRLTRIWSGLSSAEIYRAEHGWWWPDDWGCWIKPSGGALSLTVPPGTGALRAFFLLHAPNAPTNFMIEAEGRPDCERGSLAPGEFRWVIMDLPRREQGRVDIRLRGSAAVDFTQDTGGLDNRVASLGLAGFLFCAGDDTLGRISFLEAVTLGALDQLAFDRNESGLPLGEES